MHALLLLSWVLLVGCGASGGEELFRAASPGSGGGSPVSGSGGEAAGGSEVVGEEGGTTGEAGLGGGWGDGWR
ncbi:MAG: hypothetical protein RMJ98_13390, partial [Myxococcales bacterium]|nr:hypothetical protein [Myxococcales bacterium]